MNRMFYVRLFYRVCCFIFILKKAENRFFRCNFSVLTFLYRRFIIYLNIFKKGTKLDLRPHIQLIDFDKFDLKKLSESEFNSMVEKKQRFVQLNDAMRMCKNFGNKTFNTIETSSNLNLGVKEMFEMAIRSALRV